MEAPSVDTARSNEVHSANVPMEEMKNSKSLFDQFLRCLSCCVSHNPKTQREIVVDQSKDLPWYREKIIQKPYRY